LGDNGAISTALAINNNDERFDAYDYLIGSGTHPRGIAIAGVMTQQTTEDVVYEPIQLTNPDGSPQVDENGDPVLSDVCEVVEPVDRPLVLRRALTPGNASSISVSMSVRNVNNDPCEDYYPADPAGIYNDNVNRRSFFTKLENAPDTVTFTGETDHSGWLTDSELKLLREWVDMGGQYYNNPFDAPSN